MSSVPTDEDLTQWHKYFAVQSNNRAWDLATQSRTPAESEEMLHAAHAAFLHWTAIGTEQHRMRAKMLLAEVHALMGYGESAISYADEMYNYFLDSETSDWECALAHTIYAHAAYVAEDVPAYQAAYEKAKRAIEDIADAEDKAIVEETFNRVPSE